LAGVFSLVGIAGEDDLDDLNVYPGARWRVKRKGRTRIGRRKFLSGLSGTFQSRPMGLHRALPRLLSESHVFCTRFRNLGG